MINDIQSEKEITKNWLDDEVVVTICCITYNHENFIEETLNGFLMQETDFPFEIIIHDDASNDNTTSIIKEYEIKYPNIIKPIYQIENQFSKSVDFLSTIIIPKAKGKYIAYCEGDDYWVDKGKLQKSVDFLNKNKEFSGCAHDVYIIDESRKYTNKTPFGDYHGDINSIEDQIRYYSIPTLSLVFRKNSFDCDLFHKLKENTKYVGDIQLKCMLLSKGKIKYFDEKMGVYRWIQSGGCSFSSQSEMLQLWDAFISLFNIYYYIKEAKSYYFENHFVSVANKLKKIANSSGDYSWKQVVEILKSKSFYGKFCWLVLRRKLTPRFIRKILERKTI